MRKTLALLVCLPLTACVVGSGATGGGDDGTGGGDDANGGGSGSGSPGISGNIAANATWSEAVLIEGITTIQPGVTITIAAGTTITVKSVGSLIVQGTLDAQGTSAGHVTIKPEQTTFNGVTVSPGGVLKYSYVDQTGGGLATNGTATATVVDSHFSHAPGDFLMMSGGTLDVSYSWIGVDTDATDTTHCDMHFGGSGNVIKFTHSNVSSSSYGVMFYGGMSADFKLNNWFSNTTDVDTTTSSPVTGDFSGGWFEKGAPSGTGITANTPAGARLPACDGTNNDTCAGPRA